MATIKKIKNIGLWFCLSFMTLGLFVGIPRPASADIEKTFSQPEDLGPVVTSVAAMDSTYGVENGHDVMYTTVKGNPGVFQVVDLDTYELLRTYELDGLGGSWTHAVDHDGNVYIGGSGKLFKYSPSSQTMTDLGTVVPGAREVYGLSIDEEGHVYGGTYPDAHVFRYDPETDEIHDYGSVKPDQDYVRSMTYANGTVYAGIGIKGSIVTIDTATGETGTLSLPDRPEYYDVDNLSTIWALDIVDHYLFVHLSAGPFLVYDLEEGVWLPETITGSKGLAMTPEHDGKTYFVANNKVMSFDLTNETIEDTGLTYGSYIRNAGWVTLDDPEFPGTSLVTISFNGSVVLFNFQSGTRKTLPPIVEGQPTTIQTMEKGPDGNIYFSGYMGTFGARYNTSNDKIKLFNLGQAEGMTSLGDKMYMGTYPGANIFEYDTSLEPEKGSNPHEIFSLSSEGQDRPFAMSSGDGKLFIGTIPTYGQLGGALTIYDPNDMGNDPQTYRHVVEDQSIIGLAYRDGKIYGSTSVWGGLGIDPTAEEAKMFVWDVNAGEKLTEFTPDLPGEVTPKAIGGLSFGPDGLLWGASYGTIFAMDPETLEIVKSKEIVPTNWNFNHYWRPVHLRWADDGLLYTTLAGQITVIDPESLEYVQLERSPLMTLGDDGNIYYADAGNLKKITVRDGLPPEKIEIDVDLENAGFESPLMEGVIPGWSENWSSEKAIFNVSDERSYSGEYSLKLQDTSTTETVAVLSDSIGVIPGKKYTARSQVYLDEGRTLFMMRFFDSNGNELHSEASYITSGHDQWQETIVSEYAPDNAASVRVYAFVTQYWMATAYYDDISLSYEIDETELPGLELISPESGWITNDITPDVIVHTKNNSNVRIMEGEQVIGESNVIADEETTITLDGLSDGTHDLVVIAETEQGVPGDPVSFTIHVDTVSPDTPIIVSPEKPMSTNDRTPEVKIKAEAGATIQIFGKGEIVGTGTGSGDEEVTIELDKLDQGIHKLKAIAIDEAGNESNSADLPHIIINNANGH
ncbi:Ig-like domain-containing protein [Pseudalkalibacillus sp. A8]|uniref:Ig-like domain-containing protein n=1 Tax=Pseudalkalibacillus sp. A8 TaxID=3382641 RepID=UPI0038B44153